MGTSSRTSRTASGTARTSQAGAARGATPEPAGRPGQIVRREAPPAAFGLFARAALGSLPGPRRPDHLPDIELVLPDRTVDRDHLAGYARLCGFPLADRLPVTYPHLLGFGLALDLMSRRDFPFPAAGLVHVANRIVAHRPVDAGEPLTVRVRAHGLAEHQRGRQFTVSTEVAVAGETVWSEQSDYLRRTGGRRRSGGSPPRGPADEDEPEPTAVWRFPAGIGRRYAAVSGDLNPIHLNRLAARALGFRRTIAHGMYTAARAVAALGPRVPPAATVDLRFGGPVLLPATLWFTAVPDGAGWDLTVRGRSGRTHLTGAVRPLPEAPTG